MSKEGQKRAAYCIRIIHRLGGSATSVDVPIFVHGVTFVDNVLDNSLKSYQISLCPVVPSDVYRTHALTNRVYASLCGDVRKWSDVRVWSRRLHLQR